MRPKPIGRREKKELYKSVIELQYGVQPPAPPELMAVEMLYNGDKTRVYRIKSGTEAHPVTFRMKLILPDNAVNPPAVRGNGDTADLRLEKSEKEIVQGKAEGCEILSRLSFFC